MIAIDIDMLKRSQLHDYQQRAVEFIETHPHCCLILDMGLGKTVTTLTAVSDLIDLGVVRRVLVVAPLRVAQSVWHAEIEHWEHLAGIRATKVLGAAKSRLNGLNEVADIQIINREMVPWLVEQVGRDLRRWDMIVIDELSSFKNHQSKRFKALCKLRPKRVVGLTGTPAPNGLMDLWAQYRVIDGGECLGKSFYKFRAKYFSAGYGNGQIVYEWYAKPDAQETIQEAIRPISISMTKEEYLSLPPLVKVTREVELSERERKLYAKLKRDAIVEVDMECLTAQNAAVLSNKLLQMASGAVYDDERNVVPVHDAKIEALREIVEGVSGNVLVAYGYQHELERILSGLKEYKPREIKGEESIAAWQRGEIRVGVGHPASMGHGLNLQSGGCVLVWFGLTWSLELYEQCCARLYRQGQRERVTIIHLVSKGTIDEKVLESLSGKRYTQSMVIDSVKAEFLECM